MRGRAGHLCYGQERAGRGEVRAWSKAAVWAGTADRAEGGHAQG